MKDIIIKAENVKYSYNEGESYSLNGLSLEIERGKKIAVMGANGSGKSTFFLCCNGIFKPQSGTIYFNGKAINYNRKELLNLRSKVGIVFQDPDNQLFSASVYQEISFGILNKGISEEKAKEEVNKIIDDLEITTFKNNPTHALSGGQKKQVSIADIVVMNPEVIILDEPYSSLDPKHTAIVNNIVENLTKKGITVLMSLHDVDYALEWADEVLLFHQGTLLKQGKPLEIFNDVNLLSLTNLNQPAVIKLFNKLKEKNIINSDLKTPKSLQQLTDYIDLL